MTMIDFIAQPSFRTTQQVIDGVLATATMNRIDIAAAYITSSGIDVLLKTMRERDCADNKRVVKRWNAALESEGVAVGRAVISVGNCGAQLCPNNFFTIQSWYEPRGGPTFLLVDPTIPVIHAPPFASEAAETHHFGPLTVYVFDYDIAKHIRVVASS